MNSNTRKELIQFIETLDMIGDIVSDFVTGSD